MTRAHAIKFRAPYTTNTDFRKAVNNGEINYTDIHLSQVAQRLRSGFLGHVTTAIVEACELTDDGRIYLTAGVGLTPTIARLADRIIIELNAAHSKRIIGMHDLYEMERPPYRRPIPIVRPSDRSSASRILRLRRTRTFIRKESLDPLFRQCLGNCERGRPIWRCRCTWVQVRTW